MKIAITGGAGFLGSNLSRELLNRGNEIISLDNFSTGSPKNIQELSKNSRYTFIEHDVRNPLALKVDLIINLACPASPPRYQLNPIGTLMTNVLGMYNVLESARVSGARVIQASTSEVYGDPLVHPQVEEYWGNVNPIGDRSCYDEGKRAAETLCEDYRRQFGMDVTLLRIFNTYGPFMARDDGRVVSNFIVQALENKSITIYGTGNQTRSFCYVSDLIGAFVKVVESVSIVGPINIGNPREINMMTLASKIVELTNSKSEILKSSLPKDDPLRRKPDISKARELLKWEPVVDLDVGLKKTIEYFVSF